MEYLSTYTSLHFCLLIINIFQFKTNWIALAAVVELEVLVFALNFKSVLKMYYETTLI